jgi:RNA polymerase sigma-70 factor (ECF subfamily)
MGYLCGSIIMNLAQTITLYQPLLHRIAYNLVRCKEDAEDIVQDTFTRWLTIDPKKIENTKAYLVRAVTNNCLNHLQTLQKKKTEYLDSVSETFRHFVETNLASLDLDVKMEAALAVLHAKLEPLERAVFLLKEAFDFDYEELQATFNKNKEHCRQLVCRAKKKLSAETSWLHMAAPQPTLVLESIKKSVSAGDIASVVRHLKEQAGK